MYPIGSFPGNRLRRPRAHPWSRALLAETRLHAADFILPLFVQEGEVDSDIPALPGVKRLCLASTIAHAREAKALGIPAVALFPVVPPERKTPDGEEALNPENLICRAVSAVKREAPGIGVIADVALDPYTTHGHDGVLNERGEVDNDSTVDMLCRQAVLLAAAGCDVVAPSDMMDGRIGAIRALLEMQGFQDTMILAYSAKYASALYSPFREAVGSAQSSPIDKRGYQMNPANAFEALREAAQDIQEGADMLMVKPAGLYLDIIHRLNEAYGVPVIAYQVSGEYAWLHDKPEAMHEALTAIKRAGARAIVTYGAVEMARKLESGTENRES